MTIQFSTLFFCFNWSTWVSTRGISNAEASETQKKEQRKKVVNWQQLRRTYIAKKKKREKLDMDFSLWKRSFYRFPCFESSKDGREISRVWRQHQESLYIYIKEEKKKPTGKHKKKSGHFFYYLMRHFVRKQNALPFPYKKKKKETEQLIHNYSCICKTKIKKDITTKGGIRRECSEDKCNNFCRQVVAASLEVSLSLLPCFVTSSPAPGLASLPLAKLTRTLAVYRWYVYCNNIKKKNTTWLSTRS